MATMRTAVCIALLGCGLGCGPGQAAEAEPAGDVYGSLGEPTAAFLEGFGNIQSVREMPDGRVLVADPLGVALYLVDMDAGTREVIGREGQGPGEYLQPDAVWPLPGDSTLLVDLGNARLISLDRDLTFGPTMPIQLSPLRSGAVIALPEGVDAAGRLYFQARGVSGREPVPILRVDRSTRAAETVAFYEPPARRGIGRFGVVPLSPEDAWGVAPDGSVVIARSDDYSLERIGPDGSAKGGPPTPYPPVSIGAPEKEGFLAEWGHAGGDFVIRMTADENRNLQMSFSRGGPPVGGRAPTVDDYQWPDFASPFYPGRLEIDGEGRTWVRRRVAAGALTTYDVFSSEGLVDRTVTLGPGRRVIGFGTDAVYVLTYDQFDLNYLERYAMPTL